MQFTKCVHIIIGGLFLLYNYNLIVLTVIVIKMTTFYLLMLFRSRSVLWAYAGLWLFIINFSKSETVQEQIKQYAGVDDEELYEIVNIMCWNLLKLLSVSLENVDEPKDIEASAFYGYVLYYPNMTLGPILIFRRYKNMLLDRETGLSVRFMSRLFKLVKRLICVGFWLMLTDFALHYIFLVNLQHNIKVCWLFGLHCEFRLSIFSDFHRSCKCWILRLCTRLGTWWVNSFTANTLFGMESALRLLNLTAWRRQDCQSASDAFICTRTCGSTSIRDCTSFCSCKTDTLRS